MEKLRLGVVGGWLSVRFINIYIFAVITVICLTLLRSRSAAEFEMVCDAYGILGASFYGLP